MPIPTEDRRWISLRRVCLTKDGAVALALHSTPSNVGNQAVVLRLSHDGRSTSAAIPLAVESPAVCWNLIVTAPTSAVALVADRTESRSTQPSGVIHANPRDTPTWFSVDWKDRLRAKPLGRWEDVNMMVDTQVARFGRQTVWVSCEMTAEYTEWGDFRLVLGDGHGQRKPKVIHTDVWCSGMSQPVKVGERIFLLLTAKWKQLELWSFDEAWSPTREAIVDRPRKTPTGSVGQVAAPQLFADGNSLLLMWASYTDPYKGGRWQGIPLACRYDPGSGELTKPVWIAEDDQVVSPTLSAADLGDSKLVMWEHRPKRGGGGTHAVCFCHLEELPKRPARLESALPLFVVDPRGPLFRSGYWDDTNGWACADQWRSAVE